MRKSVLSVRSRVLSQVAVISLLAGLTAACSGDASRFGIPAFTGSTANQKAIIGGDQPMPAPVQPSPYTPPSQVQRSSLPPTSAQQDALLPGVAPSAGAVATAAEPQPLARPAPAAAVATNSGKGGWDTTGGTVVTLGAGETLSSISRRYGVPVKELARANNITDPSAVGVGARITIPTYGVAGAAAKPVAAAVEDKKLASVADTTTSLGGLHTVTPGQTLDQVARLYNVSPKEIAAANHLNAADTLKSGQKIKIPGHSPSSTAALRPDPARKPELAQGEEPEGTPVATAKPQVDVPETTASIAPVPTNTAAGDAAKEMAAAAAKTPPADQTASAPVADAPSANGTSFRWPVRGRIIGSFGTAATGERNDGINLAVPEGTSIKAVEAGTVIYAGNELEGYGNLVLIRHADGWVSAYAHNSQILVKRGDTVRRGQIVSRAGTSGSVNAPQLHFELRKGSKPVNPMDYLQG
ncbi:Murein DD-endopeptidase MepM and murein hydrolase activator NlpD, contain LysM domain [Kaistia soli DSM 19436]|uniref:Murein DD-endopeptidase MepM and murein hydrolase activator NlpD, contain LysM domain n=1 Tax=Kaistia soli DSM 19436 TaxID=1122133 RepID=A0A1M5GN34_9HYPH|nr:peptidoglycan DD-metalloendopeptidase family protein [Kaistia soli]SHG04961.1 Murein DD-endopeptidase MepM and murein hydrolase activator NlpD, contain LysM domain [Kaistia soli DSM 19436]